MASAGSTLSKLMMGTGVVIDSPAMESMSAFERARGGRWRSRRGAAEGRDDADDAAEHPLQQRPGTTSRSLAWPARARAQGWPMHRPTAISRQKAPTTEAMRGARPEEGAASPARTATPAAAGCCGRGSPQIVPSMDARCTRQSVARSRGASRWGIRLDDVVRGVTGLPVTVRGDDRSERDTTVSSLVRERVLHVFSCGVGPVPGVPQFAASRPAAEPACTPPCEPLAGRDHENVLVVRLGSPRPQPAPLRGSPPRSPTCGASS